MMSECLSFVMHLSPCSQKSAVVIRAAIWKAVSGDENEIVESEMRTDGKRNVEESESNNAIDPFFSPVEFMHLDFTQRIADVHTVDQTYL